MNLHNKILNIPCPYALQLAEEHEDPDLAVYYRMGHKDARHEAAELAIEYEYRIKKLQEELEIAIAQDIGPAIRLAIQLAFAEFKKSDIKSKT